MPSYVHNHGILNLTDLQALLQESKVFIGMGFPYEGPAPLEAIAHGCFFLNPRIIPPLDRTNSQFFAGKPTLRSITSQNPYTERFIGKPYVYTFDMNNATEVESVLVDILAQPVSGVFLKLHCLFPQRLTFSTEVFQSLKTIGALLIVAVLNLMLL